MNPIAPRPAAIILQVRDLTASLHFYRDLVGIPLERGMNEPKDDFWTGGEHAEYSWRKGGYIHFALFPATTGKRASGTRTQLGFMVQDVEEAHKKLVAGGATVIHAPRPEPWGSTGRYEDPDGNSMGLTGQRK